MGTVIGAGCPPCLSILIIITTLVTPCEAKLPTIALYGIVAGGALFLVLTAVLTAYCISRCRCRNTSDDDVESGKNNKPKKVEKSGGKTTKAKPKKTVVASKSGEKHKKDAAKGKAKKEEKKTVDKKDKKIDKKTENKIEKEKKNKGTEKDKATKEKDKKKDKNKDKKGDKQVDKKGKDAKETSKDKWKQAASKIVSFRNGVSPIKPPAKEAWTKTLDASKKAPPKRWN